MSGFEQLLIGRVIGGHYRVEEVLGDGGFGVVFRATDLREERAEREVALKVLKLPVRAAPEEVTSLRARFRREASYAALLPPHPGIVAIHDYGTDRGLDRDYIVMELLEGEDLRARLSRPAPISIPASVRILRDVAQALAVGHGVGLVHRDIKPGNIFLALDPAREEPRVRVLDFGIAKPLISDPDHTSTHLTRDGRAPLSGRYAAPEQLRGERDLGYAADVFALGVVAFELLTRTRLFTDSDQGRREAGLSVPIPSMVARRAEIPHELEALVRQALADAPSERFVDAGVFGRALQLACGRFLHATGARPIPTAARSRESRPPDSTRAAPEAMGRFTKRPSARDETRAPDPAHGRPEAPDARTEFLSPREPTALQPERTTAHPEPSRPRRYRFWRSTPPIPVTPPGPPPEPAEPERSVEEEISAPPARPLRLRRAARRIGVVTVSGGVLLLGGSLVMQLASDPGAGPAERPATATVTPAVEAANANREGLARFRSGEWGSAVERFRTATELSPENAEYRNNLGYALYRAGRGSEAVEVLRDVAERFPERQVAWANLADALLLVGDTTAAVEALETLLALEPTPTRRGSAEWVLNRIRPVVPERADRRVEGSVSPEPGGERLYTALRLPSEPAPIGAPAGSLPLTDEQ